MCPDEALVSGGPRVRAAGLGFSYDGHVRALSGIEFELFGGEVLGLVGLNGSGKTTLLRLVSGLLEPSTGVLNLSGPSPQSTAVVFDQVPFQDELSGREHLRLMLALRGVPRSRSGDRAAHWLSRFGLAGDADAPVRTYSLGMKRRLALAEALAAEPALLLLDEPTLGLDPLGRQVLGEAVQEMGSRGGVVIVSTNDEGFAERMCARVLVLHEGRTVVCGAPAALIAELNAPTVLHVETAGPPPTGAPPGGLSRLASAPGEITLASDRGTELLPQLCRWLETESSAVTSIQVREPGLADVFASLTGASLTGAPAKGAPPKGRARETGTARGQLARGRPWTGQARREEAP